MTEPPADPEQSPGRASAARPFLASLQAAIAPTTTPGNGSLVVTDTDHDPPSAFAVGDVAVDAIANAALASRRLQHVLDQERTPEQAPIEVSRRMASIWFSSTIKPIGWELGGAWDEIAGIYQAADGHVRLHTNAPHHRRAAIAALECDDDRPSVSEAVALRPAADIQEAVYALGGVAVALRTRQEWAEHPQGQALATEPLVHRELLGPDQVGDAPPSRTAVATRADRPLAGVRVLDLTRVLAGPVATRFLAGLGADVLRIDPPDWDEPSIVPEVTLGKRCARLNLRNDEERQRLVSLLVGADILVHGYRPGALDGLGLGADERRRINPGLVDVSLNAWGHTGPWSARRGFDSIVQVACGIAAAGQEAFGTEGPKPLPFQALDHATGYTLAAAAIEGWCERLRSGAGSRWRTSLAAHAELLCAGPAGPGELGHVAHLGTVDGDFVDAIEDTTWGPTRRARSPVKNMLAWAGPAVDLGSTADPAWLPRPESGLN